MCKVMTALNYTANNMDVQAYSDSEIVLAWIKNEKECWKAYTGSEPQNKKYASSSTLAPYRYKRKPS